MDSDWWEAVDVATGEAGTVPRNYVIPDNNNKEAQTYDYRTSRSYSNRLRIILSPTKIAQCNY